MPYFLMTKVLIANTEASVDSHCGGEEPAIGVSKNLSAISKTRSTDDDEEVTVTSSCCRTS